jgi:hypothetical protein
LKLDKDDYPQELYDTIRERWLAGWSDRDIGILTDRPERWVRNRRNEIGLTAKNYPHRKSQHGRLNYTPEEEQDILTSHESGEPTKSLAMRYGVNERTINTKITQLIWRKEKPKVAPSSRTCLRCSTPFVSALPKSINRICTTCRTEADWNAMI